MGGWAEGRTRAAAQGTYVALGDSYSSGLGIGSYVDSATACGRSAGAFPSIIAAAHGLDLVLRACSGATIADVLDLQMSAVDEDTTHVTVTAGGNDAGFARVLSECALPAWASDAHAAIDGAQRYITTTLEVDLAPLFDTLRRRAPVATVVVVGYPRLFAGEDCNALTWFAPEELRRLNDTADLLNHHISVSAHRAGFAFADPTRSFLGHAVCQDEWINGLSAPIDESYHPHAEGHRLGYAPVVGPLLVGAEVAVPEPAAVAVLGEALSEQCAAYRDLDSAIVARPVTPPDLHRPDVLVAAQKAGVDVDDPESVDEADRRYADLQARRRRPLPFARNT
jgi:lysophospholipase L1-like esterase